jgi:hypothetical protein
MKTELNPLKLSGKYIFHLTFRVFCDVKSCSHVQLRYIPEDSELHTRRRESLKSHIPTICFKNQEFCILYLWVWYYS